MSLPPLARASQPRETRCGNRILQWGSRTYVVGILNVTPDSFSGDGIGGDVERAVSQAVRFAAEGADILDIGGESTRPGANAVSLQEELDRVLPVIEAVQREVDVPLSIDTYKAAVAREAVSAGAAMVNDVWGLGGDPAMGAAVAALAVPVVLMHNRRSQSRQSALGGYYEQAAYGDVAEDVTRELGEAIARASSCGIAADNIIIDPGIGFGKTPQQNIELMRNLGLLQRLGQPVLIGTSRKSFIGLTLDLPVEERLEGTAATVALAIAQGVDLVRVHDVGAMVRVCRMTDAIVRRS
ncbi:MAG: dihydropteroate synthase [Chloroflexi bacterium]|nr:dihydropteroate synthase [Chloroflexota bacterium]